MVLIGISWPFGRYGWLECLLAVCSFGWGGSVMDDPEPADVPLIEFVLSPLSIVIHLEIYFSLTRYLSGYYLERWHTIA